MKFRKLYYLPGIISLIGLTVFLPYVYDKTIIKPSAAIDLNVPKIPDNEEEPGYSYSIKHILNAAHNKKKLRITLNGDQITNQKKLELIRFEARKLKFSFDTTSIIWVKFTGDLPYSDFIRLLEICRIDSIRRYAVWDRNCIIFGEYPPKLSVQSEDSIQLITCGTRRLITVPKTSLMQEIRLFINPFTIPQISSLAVVWLIMAFFSLNYIRKRKKIIRHFSSTP
jgi:hypothetical protein